MDAAHTASVPVPDAVGIPCTDGLEISGECTPAEFRKFLRSIPLEEADEGWIDERGILWPCPHEYYKHGEVASAVLGCEVKDAELEADKRGWLRLSDYGNRTKARRLNQRQLDTLWDWCEAHGCLYQEVLQDIQYL